jgi:hypothetical protein
MELSNGGHRTYDREVGIQGNYMQFHIGGFTDLIRLLHV